MSALSSRRYASYASAHGRTPVAMIEHDMQQWRGARMCGYLVWIGQQWREWRRCNPSAPIALSREHHAQFDAWLERATYRDRMLAHRALLEMAAAADRGERA